MSKKTEKDFKIRQEIVAQAISEIQFARRFKQGKIQNWKANEDMYYGRKPKSEDSRANVDLSRMPSFVHAILAKIDNPLTFKYKKRKESQLPRVEMLNALKNRDQQDNDWDYKDVVGKKQGVIYGRSVYSYFADSIDGYKSHLDNVDVYDFLIDPSAGGINIEKADYLGNYGVVLKRKQIEAGIKDKTYLKEEAQMLLDGVGNSTETTQETNNQRNRTTDNGTYTNTGKEINNPDKFKFWHWYTTFEGERYYLLLCEKGAQAIEVCPLEEKFASGLWPYWTWAAFPDLTEFWTPSFCDYVRDLFIAQAVSINQMIDNAEQINKPQIVIDVGAFDDLSQLKYRKNGRIEAKAGTDVQKAYYAIPTPSINTPLAVFDKLTAISDRTSGVTAGDQGDASNNTGAKATIYKGNQENSADGFGFLNKSYSFGYKRFSKLYELGVGEHLIVKTAVEILGPEGVETKSISRRDIFRKNDAFGVIVESSNAEVALSAEEKQSKMNFLIANAQNLQVQNPKKAYEIGAGIAGFDPDTIRELQDVANFGDAKLLAEAMRDIEAILDGEEVKPNQAANNSYKQKFVDYMKEYKNDLSDKDFAALTAYVALIDPIVTGNMVQQGNALLMKSALMNASAGLTDGSLPNGGRQPVPGAVNN